jgi:hypothetical protein
MSVRLGCAESYRVVIHGRGGVVPAAQPNSVTSVAWDRRLDDTSTATVVMAKRGLSKACCQQLANVDNWSHEVSLYRDGWLVWQGPIVDILESRTTITLTANDVTALLRRRTNLFSVIQIGANAADLTTIAQKLIMSGFAYGQDDPEFLANVEYHPTGIVVERTVAAKSVLLYDELGELVKLGLDFTTVGRKLILAGELANALPSPPGTLRDDDVIGDVQVERAGMDFATRVQAVGDGVSAQLGGSSQYYGTVDRQIKVQGATGSVDIYTAAQGLLAITTQMPTYLRVQDGAQLAPTAPITIDQLVCGVQVDLAMRRFCRPLPPQGMRLSRVTVRWAAAGETVGVSLSPLDLISDGVSSS